MPKAPTAMLINYYSKRWTIEPGFRDIKDIRFGMGLSATRIGEPTRRDRLLLINAVAMVLLMIRGAAGESLGMARQLKSNTSKTRTHSLFRQGCMLYELIPPCQSTDWRRSWRASPQRYCYADRSVGCSRLYEMRGSAWPEGLVGQQPADASRLS
jgi:hypothetical protein